MLITYVRHPVCIMSRHSDAHIICQAPTLDHVTSQWCPIAHIISRTLFVSCHVYQPVGCNLSLSPLDPNQYQWCQTSNDFLLLILLTFNVTRTQSIKNHTLNTTLRQCWTVAGCKPLLLSRLWASALTKPRLSLVIRHPPDYQVVGEKMVEIQW